jgi:hypothetical protein
MVFKLFTIEKLNPIPTPSITGTVQRRKKQKFEIFTEIPNKEVLLACELRKKRNRQPCKKKQTQ